MQRLIKYLQTSVITFLLAIGLSACSNNGSNVDNHNGHGTDTGPSIVVNSLDDVLSPPGGIITLRSAIESALTDQHITFASSLDGVTINLTLAGEEHSILKGELYNPDQTYAGFHERDYGRSALYARKNVVIDASNLPHGIIINWAGGDSNRARVLAVYGNLTLKNVTITNGYSSAVALAGTQPYTLARGGAVAVWGKARLENCTFSGNSVSGDTNASRDRGAFGGAIYGDVLIVSDCIVSGNAVIGYGAAGGGIYSVGGTEVSGSSSLARCAVTGNRTTAQHSYGGGVFSEGGGRGGSKTINLENCTIARNLVMDNPDIAEAPSGYYYRGGGVYMSNGALVIMNCTIAENVVTGNLATFSGKPNMGGGGVAATIGDAHVVEKMEVGQSIITGNTVNGVANDLYTGSLIYFNSCGYNLIGALDFSQILVPVPPVPWWSLSRKHWPKIGDQDGVVIGDVISLSSVQRHNSIISAGVDNGERAVLWYPPAGEARDQIPASSFTVDWVLCQYSRSGGSDSDFLYRILEKVRNDYGLGSSFGQDIVYNVHDFVPEGVTWPRMADNAGWIKFWKDLDIALGSSIGTVKLGDNFWNSLHSGAFGSYVTIEKQITHYEVIPLIDDQRGRQRPIGSNGDIGAIEQ